MGLFDYTAPASTGPAFRPQPKAGDFSNTANIKTPTPQNPEPETFKRLLVGRYPEGKAYDGTLYRDMDARELTKRVVSKNPDGRTSAGVPYKSYLPPEPVPEPTPQGATPFGNSALGKVGNALSNMGVGLGSIIGQTGLGLGQSAVKVIAAGAGAVGAKGAQNALEDVAEGIGTISKAVYQDPFKAELGTISGKVGQGIGTAATYLAPSTFVTKSQKGITGVISALPGASKVAQFGKGALNVVGRAVPEAASGAVIGTAASGGDFSEGAEAGLLQGGISAGFGILGSAARGVKSLDSTKSVLSATSGIPRGAMDAVQKTGLNKAATPEQALQVTRTAVMTVRKNATQMWQERLPHIADEFKDVRTGLSEGQVAKLTKVVDEFGIDEKYIPQNLKNVSAKEFINLMKGVNEINSTRVAMSPRGAIVRSLKEELKGKALSAFGGDKGSVAKLWKDYSVMMDIMDNADDIVRAYQNKPGATVTAKNRLMAIFDDNKPEYLKAIQDLEKELGINITGQVASTKFIGLLPQSILKADGGLPTQGGAVNTLIKILALPLTSPKFIGKVLAPAGESGVLSKRLFGAQADAKAAVTRPPTTKPAMNASIMSNTLTQKGILDQAKDAFNKVKKKGILDQAKDAFNKVKKKGNRLPGMKKFPQPENIAKKIQPVDAYTVQKYLNAKSEGKNAYITPELYAKLDEVLETLGLQKRGKSFFSNEAEKVDYLQSVIDHFNEQSNKGGLLRAALIKQPRDKATQRYMNKK